VYTSDNPVSALSEFKSNFYDLLLVDINMPNINGFELCEKILAIDINVKVCFMSCAAEINLEALREISNKPRMHHQKASQYGFFG
jgi:two-component SAPR family response regulator